MLHASEQPARQQLGNAGEHAVGQWLQKKGFTVITYNYRLKCGEIDLIAYRKEIIAFVEVKVRTTDYFNSSQLITLSKQKKIIATAKKFCLQQNRGDKIYRFDIALLKPLGDGFEITYIENAFTAMEW
jgi:putative endonuclease